MALLNRSAEYDHLYDSEGGLQGGLSALEELAQVIANGGGNERDQDGMDDENDEIEHSHDFPISGTSHDTGSLMDSDEDMSGDDEPGSSDDDAMEEISMYDEPQPLSAPPSSTLPDASFERFPSSATPAPVSSSPSPPNSIDTSELVLSKKRQNSGSDSEGSTARPRSSSSRRSTKRASMMENVSGPLVLGERLKKRFLEVNVGSTLLVRPLAIFLLVVAVLMYYFQDLFFEFPWNNFLHSVVYDLIHQVLTGRLDHGYNRELTVSLFRDARLMHRIIEGSKRNDIERFVDILPNYSMRISFVNMTLQLETKRCSPWIHGSSHSYFRRRSRRTGALPSRPTSHHCTILASTRMGRICHR